MLKPVSKYPEYPEMKIVFHYDDCDDCAKCGKPANYEDSITGQDYCSYECRDKVLGARIQDNENERIAEITSGGQV